MSENSIETRSNPLTVFAWLLAAVSLLLVGGSYFWWGIDFAAGVLLGSGIVGLNFWWTRRVISKALRDDSPKAILWISFLSKFGVTIAILFLAILRLGIDPLGILVGVSALVITGFGFAFIKLAV